MAQSLLSASLSCEQEYGQIADYHITSDKVASKSSQNDWVRKTQSVEIKYLGMGMRKSSVQDTESTTL